MKENTCCFTGHRAIDGGDLEPLTEQLDRQIELHYMCGVTDFCAGGASALTPSPQRVLKFRESHPDVKLRLFCPAPSRPPVGREKIQRPTSKSKKAQTR